eukprot:g70106.t1
MGWTQQEGASNPQGTHWNLANAQDTNTNINNDGKLEASDAVPAFFHLGKAVRGQQHSLMTRTRSDPACAALMRTLQLQLPSLRDKDVSNTWLGEEVKHEKC